VPGRPARRSGAATREHGNDRVRRGGFRRARHRPVALATGTQRAVAAGAPFRASHVARRGHAAARALATGRGALAELGADMMRSTRRRVLAIGAAMLIAAGAATWWWQERDVRHFLTGDVAPFAAGFSP